MTQWRDIGNGLYRREYPDYGAYLTHQASKLDVVTPANLRALDEALFQALCDRLPDLAGRRALCLGARLGGEVRAMRWRGAHAFGVDLNPGPENKFVVYGDFHKPPVPDNSVDLIYTNSLDHIFSLWSFLDDVRRVLDIGGKFVVEVPRGLAEGRHPGSYESFAWDELHHIIDAISDFDGLEFHRSWSFGQPWPGDQLWFTRS